MSSAASASNNFTSFENFSTNVQAFVPRAMDTVHHAFAKQGSFTPTHHHQVSHQMAYNSPIAKQQCYAPAAAANKASGGFSDYSSHMQAVMAQSADSLSSGKYHLASQQTQHHPHPA